jgi:3-methyl-2-oxobutanoate hydroxymethyltransferase
MGQVPDPKHPITRVTQFKHFKGSQQKIVMATCYDYTSARILADSKVDCVLVGDSVAMVMHGFPSTLSATVEMMVYHTAAVRRGLGEDFFLVADLPFPWHRKSADAVLDAVDLLMKAGASAIKIEGAKGHLATIEHLVGSGVPVMGHLGLTPQSVNLLGGYKVQAREAEAALQLKQDAIALARAGCFSLVLECVPAHLAKEVSQTMEIPTIGIGSGADCDGQVLVWQDLLGMQKDFKPRFVRQFGKGYESMKDALNEYADVVRDGSFPSEQESF